MNSVPRLWKELSESSDFVCYVHKTNTAPFFIGYFKSLTDPNVLHQHILDCLSNETDISIDDLYYSISVAEKEKSCDSKNIQSKLLRGYIAIQQGLQNQNCSRCGSLNCFWRM